MRCQDWELGGRILGVFLDLKRVESCWLLEIRIDDFDDDIDVFALFIYHE